MRRLLVATLTTLAFGAQAAVLGYELGVGATAAGHLRALSQQLARQNLLYQLHIGGQSKEDMVASAAQIDALLRDLRRGNLAHSIPAPPTDEIREQVDAVEEQWDTLRTMTHASPYDHLRMSRQFATRQSRLGDPLLIRHFDALSLGLVEQADRLLDLYLAECRKVGYKPCEMTRNSGLPVMWAERIASESVLVYAGLDVERNKKRLRASREAYEVALVGIEQIPVLREASGSSMDQQAEFAKGLLQRIRVDWETLRGDVDLVLEGRADEIHLTRMLAAQERMTRNHQRVRAALENIGTVQYGG